MDTKKLICEGKPLMIAHRGVSGIEPENTLSAFIAAANRSYYGIETDVHKTADGKFILTHDDNTKRVTGVDTVVEQTDFETLRALNIFDMDKESHRVDLHMPSLREYIKICKKYEKIAVLELKNSFTPDEVKAIYNEINDEGYVSGTTFISFDINNLHYLRAIDENTTVQFLTWKQDENLVKTLAEYKFDLDIGLKGVTAELVEDCHKNGIKVNVWTVDEVADAEWLSSIGIDFITSNIVE